ncbi:MAG TPA: MaoC family dehydratase [Blastocatellia bacterium]|nr:MaoC family dehydratase [Blastocatellia bacterium]
MKSSGPRLIEPKYGRLLDDFRVGDVYHHPWEVTIDDGMLAMFAGSFLDPNPLYSSRRFASELGFRDRVVHPLVMLNLALSFTVHDISEQAIAHLAYIELKFPNAAYSGDTLSVYSEILGVRVSESKPDRGVVHLRTTGINQDGLAVVTFERKALIPTGRLEGRAHPDAHVNPSDAVVSADPAASVSKDTQLSAEAASAGTGEGLKSVTPDSRELAAAPPPAAVPDSSLPPELDGEIKFPRWPGRPRGCFEDFEVGDVILHSIGHTVGESEHMQLTILTRNSHPLHFDEVYCRERSFTKTRVVEGGLVFAWIASLASRDTTANALWEIGYDKGTHPNPVLAGDTLYAASRVIEKQERDEQTGIVRFKLVGVKNEAPIELIRRGVDLFEGKFDQKVFEIERAMLLHRSPSPH